LFVQDENGRSKLHLVAGY